MKKAFVVETMGRNCGYLAEICIIPEIKTDFSSLEKKLKNELKHGREYILAVISEGTNQTDFLVSWIKESLKIETRSIVLGHIQRGGNPTVFERLMANEFVIYAIDKLLKEKSQNIIVYKNSKFKFIDIKKISDKKQKIDKKILKQLEKMTK
jgi:6-phosphofructokinase 1